MAIKATQAVARKNQALPNPANKGLALSPEDSAEIMASLEEDETFAAALQCMDCDAEYSD